MSSEAIDPLINYGLVRINDSPGTGPATMVVVGIPRSGTSMVAAILKTLGVFMGTAIDNVVFEDRDIADALHPSKAQRLSELIGIRNAEHDIWGFKRPEAYKQLAKLCSKLRNPKVIVTFRDILAISLRNNISMQIDPVDSLSTLAGEYQALASTIKALRVPCLLISYEKAVQFPDKTVAEIADFCGIDAKQSNLEDAVQLIENGHPQYVHGSRLRYHGFVGKLTNGELRGWAKIHKQDDIRVDVELELDGKIVQRTTADLYRRDLEQAGFGDGKYGFIFTIGDRVSGEAIVNVRVANSNILVKNSGLPLSKY